MRYQCLVLDHDDTVVNSTATINYPAFVQTLQKLRPDVHMTLDDFFSYSFEPGFGALCSDILGFSDAEMDIQYQTWLDYVRTHVPDTFPGMRDLLQRFHAAGGHICVVSHSVPENILRDYRAHDLPTPERIYGWDSDPERRKPAPWPIYQIERELGLRPEQLVVIDDLKPGKDMAWTSSRRGGRTPCRTSSKRCSASARTTAARWRSWRRCCWTKRRHNDGY